NQDWVENFGMSVCEIEYITNAIHSLPAIGTLPAIGGRGERPKEVSWAEMALQMEQEDSDVAEDESEMVEVGGEEDTRDLHAEDAEGSEAEELRYMARVREQRRQGPAQKKFRPPNFSKSKFSPVPWRARAIDSSEAAIGAIHPFALQLGKQIGVAELVMQYPHIDPSKQQQVDFLRLQHLHAIDYRHAMCHKRGITVQMSAIGGLDPMPPFAQLFRSLPDTDGVGDEIDPEKFRERWENDGENLLFHLMKATEGQLKEVEGAWEPCDVDHIFALGVPKILLHPQFAMNVQQEHAWAEFGPACGNRNMRKGKGKGKDKVVSLAQAAAIGASRVLQPPAGGVNWQSRRARVISLPQLFYHLGMEFTASDLFLYWCSLPFFAVKKLHPASRPERQTAAAHLRYKATRRWRWGR
ncbi:MAG: hypothetical protein EBU08_16380, partial [Micrococcales bacterium]|nr:hypothetical protein [Micrococcales bacterium]